MDHKVLFRILLLGFLTVIPLGSFAKNLPIVTIGFISDGHSPRFENMIKQTQQEIKTLAEDEFDVRFPKSYRINGNWQLDLIKKGINTLMLNADVDIIIATDPIASHLMGHWKKIPKPVIATTIIDVELQGIPFRNNASGVKNLSYIASQKSFERDIHIFHEIVDFKHLTILVTDPFLKAIPDLKKKVQRASRKYGIEYDVIAVTDDVETVLTTIQPNTEAVLVTPLMRLSEASFQRLVNGLIEKKLPSYSLWGRKEVEAGLLASATPQSDEIRMARRIALNVNQILLGEKASTLAVRFNAGERLVINMETVRRTRFYPSWQILTRAELINDELENVSRHLTLEKAVQEAIDANLDLLAAEQGVAANKENVSQARAKLFPQVDATINGQFRDQNTSNIFTPERKITGAFNLTQIIYSDSIWANLEITGKLQEAIEQQRNSLRLDIILQTSTAYLNILKAKTIERIRKENVKRSRINLELAQTRESIGTSSRADVFRWQSKIATDRQDVLNAEAIRRQSEVFLNQILNHSQEESMEIESTELTNPIFLVSNSRLFKYVDNRNTFRMFRDFMVKEGLAQSPELQALVVSIEAQERNVLASKRNFWLPDFSLNAGYSDDFDRAGVGADLPPELGDKGWTVGLSARLPILTGGAQTARLSQTQKDLQRLKYEIASAHNQIEARIRSALHKAGASYPSIELAQQAANAAQNNLELVTDTYQKGAASIITLIDAQNATLSTELSAANAVYEFLLDLMEVQRATAKFDFFLKPAERKAWYERIDVHFKQRLTSVR